MKFMVFTKHMQGLTHEEMCARAKGIGLDGLDLCVRPGFPVEPDKAAEGLPKAAKVAKDQGIEILNITTPGDFLDPKGKMVEPMYAAAAEIHCPGIKLGYWTYKDEDYWAREKEIVKALKGFAKLSKKYGVTTLFHTHSMNFYGCNMGGLMPMVRDFDPKHVAVYLDPGHLILCGEPIEMAAAMAKGHLGLVAAKAPLWTKVEPGGKAGWAPGSVRKGPDGKPAWCFQMYGVGEGVLDWAGVFSALFRNGYAGNCSLHSEYDFPIDKWVAQTKTDLAYLKESLAKATAKA